VRIADVSALRGHQVATVPRPRLLHAAGRRHRGAAAAAERWSPHVAELQGQPGPHVQPVADGPGDDAPRCAGMVGSDRGSNMTRGETSSGGRLCAVARRAQPEGDLRLACLLNENTHYAGSATSADRPAVRMRPDGCGPRAARQPRSEDTRDRCAGHEHPRQREGAGHACACDDQPFGLRREAERA
jgi:hypothetical protein